MQTIQKNQGSKKLQKDDLREQNKICEERLKGHRLMAIKHMKRCSTLLIIRLLTCSVVSDSLYRIFVTFRMMQYSYQNTEGMQQLLAVLMFPFTINTEQPYVPPCSPEHWEHGSEQNRPKSLSPCSRHGGDRRSTRYRVKSIVSWIMTEVLKKKRKMGRKRRG